MKFLIVKSNAWLSFMFLVHNFPFTSMGKILALVMGSIILKEIYTLYFFLHRSKAHENGFNECLISFRAQLLTSALYDVWINFNPKRIASKTK